MKDPFLRHNKWIQYITDIFFNKNKYYVFSPWSQRIGHLCLEIIMAASAAKRYNKKLVFISPYKPVNTEIFNCCFSCTVHIRHDIRVLILHVLIFIPGFFNWFYNGCRNKAVKYVPIISKVFPQIFIIPRIGIEKGKSWRHRLRDTECYHDFKLLMSQKIKVKLNPVQLKKGNEISEKLGLPKDSWFVCIHARESSYLCDTFREWQNSDINNYLKAIRYITKLGGYVIRMGDPRMTRIPKMKNVIDYAHSEYKSGLMDLYLSSKARFAIVSNSGFRALPQLFGVPLITVNFYPITPDDIYLESLIIYKKVYSKSFGRLLKIKEILTNPNLCHYNTDDEYKNAGLEIRENSEDEILYAVIEMITLLTNGKWDKLNDEQRLFQSEIKKYLKNSDHVYGYGDHMFYPDTFCRIGINYIREHWDKHEYLNILTEGSL